MPGTVVPLTMFIRKVPCTTNSHVSELELQAESNFALQVLGGEERGGWSLACSLLTSHGASLHTDLPDFLQFCKEIL